MQLLCFQLPTYDYNVHVVKSLTYVHVVRLKIQYVGGLAIKKIGSQYIIHVCGAMAGLYS